MALDCAHCVGLRARLTPPDPGSALAAVLPPGSLVVDGGKVRGTRALDVDSEEVAACPCGCHDTWRWVNRRSLP